MRRLFFALSLVVGALVIPPPSPVSAQCQCDGAEPNINASSAAALATVLGRSEDLWVVEITTDVKGNLPDQVSVRTFDNHQCEVQWLAGRDISVVFDIGIDGVLTATGCSEVDVTALETWTRPPGETGEIHAVAAGPWGGYRVVAVDSTGSPLAYGYQPGVVSALSVCPESQLMVEATSHQGTSQIAVRSLTDFNLVRTVDLDDGSNPSDLACLDSGAETVLFRDEEGIQKLNTEGSVTASDSEWPGEQGGQAATDLDNRDQSIPTPSAVVVLSTPANLGSLPDDVEVEKLALSDPPQIGEWSGWLFALAAVGGLAYLAKKAMNPEWRSSWAKPDNGRNSTGRRREETRGPGRFNG